MSGTDKEREARCKALGISASLKSQELQRRFDQNNWKKSHPESADSGSSESAPKASSPTDLEKKQG